MPTITANGTAVALEQLDGDRVAIKVDSIKLDGTGSPSFSLHVEVPSSSPMVAAVPIGAPVNIQISVPNDLPPLPVTAPEEPLAATVTATASEDAGNDSAAASGAPETADQGASSPPADSTPDASADVADEVPADDGSSAAASGAAQAVV